MKKQLLLSGILIMAAFIWLVISSTVTLAQVKLPDLTIVNISVGEKDCSVTVTVRNAGPGIVPNKVWSVHSPQSSSVLLYKDGKRWGGASIWKLDPKKVLQKPGGTVKYTSKLKINGKATIKATVDETKQVREISEKNNSKTITRICPRKDRECDYDLRANIWCQLTSRRDQFRGKIKIIGYVRNIGKKAWRCSAQQARALLEEKAPGARPRVIKSEALTRLNPEEVIKLEYNLDWSTSTEFPPDYTIRIDLDPDILMDNNPANDDCNYENNLKELKATTINSLF